LPRGQTTGSCSSGFPWASRGNFGFKTEVYRQVGHLVRNYHNLNWDVNQPGDAITVPVLASTRLNWKNDVYWPGGKGPATRRTFASSSADSRRITLAINDPGQAKNAGATITARPWPATSARRVRRGSAPRLKLATRPGSKFDRALFKTIFRQTALGIRDGDPQVQDSHPAVSSAAGRRTTPRTCGTFTKSRMFCLCMTSINLHTYASVERENSGECPWNRSLSGRTQPSPTSKWWMTPLPGATPKLRQGDLDYRIRLRRLHRRRPCSTARIGS